MKHPCVYMLASDHHGTLYVGVTSNLLTRVWHHRNDVTEGFTRKYGVHDLVWFESHESMAPAIQREKAIKAWRREWKIQLIEERNPRWLDLYPTLLQQARKHCIAVLPNARRAEPGRGAKSNAKAGSQRSLA
ncbi:hypothetical protein GCM10027359_01840 [Marilutibacter aestuarii]|uniref:GIY-YIG nuclease family protein n=2 Tax=Marilutibacter aestuarii TaxID=1706195 RepID=A0A508AB26_9GAMM|nr:GIY-YIG nuclease family protein [Lysobacter aestuarii]